MERSSKKGSQSVRDVGQDLVFALFFFQAEDGIRDLTVTGVQTCALPIFEQRLFRLLFDDVALVYDGDEPPRRRIWVKALESHRCLLPAKSLSFSVLSPRSEERRVGKECRSRWSPYH